MFAVVGLDCLLPGAATADAWMALREPVLGPVPAGRWPMDPSSVLDPAPGTVDRTPTTVGAFIVDEPDDVPLIDGVDLEALDPLFRWTLRVVGNALRDVPVERRRTGLILANLGLPSTGMVEALAGRAAVENLRHQGLPAQLAAAAFDLAHGTSLDAACASGLYAVRLACDQLASGALDAVVAAGVQRSDSAYLFLGFSQLHALSGSGCPRPFDRRADGLIVGEGAAAVALMRLEDAIARGARIHAVIRGGGICNDGRKGNMLAPSATGQLRALQEAWDRAGLSPTALGYVECHATGTPLGDRVEAEALHALLAEAWHRGSPVAVSSAKGLVGHTITVAGLAGLIRAVGALHGERPPGAEQPIEAIEASPHLTTAGGPWPEGPRIAAVSAFGFGGTDAHVLLARYEDLEPPLRPMPRSRPAGRLAVVGLSMRLGPLEHEQVLTALQGDEPLRTRIAEVRIDPRRWRIPPVELADLLPQQILALETAADAVGGLDLPLDRTASIVGIEVDAHVADAVHRWACLDDPAQADALAPPLTTARVQGQLPNFVANRIAAQLDLRGPSYTVGAGRLSGLVALAHAGRLLADDAADVVLAGAVDLPAHPRAPWRGKVAEGAVIFALTRPEEAERRGWPVLATLDPVALERGPADPPDHPPAIGDGGAVDGLFRLLTVLARGGGEVIVGDFGEARAQTRVSGLLGELPARKAWDRVLVVPHTSETPPGPGWRGSWSADTLPVPTPRRSPPAHWVASGPEGAVVPLCWNPRATPPPPRPSAPPPRARPGSPTLPRAGSPILSPPPQAEVSTMSPPAKAPSPPPPVAPRPGAAALLATEIAGLAELADAMARSSARVAEVHGRFLAGQQRAMDLLAQAASFHLAPAVGEGVANGRPPSHGEPRRRTEPGSVQEPVAPPRTRSGGTAPPPRALGPRGERVVSTAATSSALPAPRTFDRDALLLHATGRLSEVFGPGWADLDAYEPRVRMPFGELLLCDRVLALEGERGVFGPSRIVTEYDLPAGRDWTPDGRPPTCVVVESGQADLFLVSFLGIDERCRGERVYRLLDCDLTFHGPRPPVGETLRHDIRIERFARLGGTTLFYFAYDCVAVSTGRPVLTMRNGCAGFFTPAELARPKGLDKRLSDGPAPAPVAPLVPGAPSSLDARAVRLLAAGRASEALGPAFAPADDATLGLPPSDRWRLVHRVPHLSHTGGPHGLGEVVVEQDLADDDWFNPIHFQGDPCMPGTLMLEGCLQTVQVWLLGLGAATRWPAASFEPMAGRTMRLRCRGQVAPGHRQLTYRARIREAGLDPAPWAVADVILAVDGVEVVVAHDVGVQVVGDPVDDPTASVDPTRLLAFSVGSAAQAFGPRWAPFDEPGRRCARMPGPPLATMTRVLSVEGPPMESGAPRSAEVAWSIPEDAWYFQADHTPSLPFAALLEGALQPCGWLTAWQGHPIASDEPRYFRNLGGELVLHAEVPPGVTVRTKATLTSVSSSGGMTITRFRTEMFAGERPILTATTDFGYFTAAALAHQKGLSLGDDGPRLAHLRGEAAIPPVSPQRAAREDWRFLHRVVAADPTAGRHGQGFYAGEADVNPDAWFFAAHFHQDPVMPGSLGLEGLLQLARHALIERVGGDGRVRPLALGQPVRWTYRGQVLQTARTMGFDLEVREIVGRTLLADGWVRVDGLTIFAFEGFAVELVEEPVAPLFLAPRPAREPGPAALLDRFVVDGDSGHGVLRLDPAVHPWLADHRPTLTAPALPMAFAAEIAAEAAQLLRPGKRVVGLPRLEAERWVHTGEGPVDLRVVAVAEGDTVAVTLAVHTENPRFPHLSGPRAHMRAVVQLGDRWAPAEPAPAVDAEPSDLDARAYYDGGHTFHGPVLQGMIALDRLGSAGAVATFATRPDEDLLGAPGRFVLDPLLLDTATHPMCSSQPERWVPGLEPGHLAYPVHASDMRFFGPRPQGQVRATLRLVEGTERALTFDVHLAGPDGPWCAFRWTEAIVQAGPLLGWPAPIRRAFLWDHQPVPEVRVGRPVSGGWEVRREDRIEPLPGTLAGLTCAPCELEERAASEDVPTWDLARLAAKEAARSWLRERLGRDVHPRHLVLHALRPDRLILIEAPTLTASELIDHLGPTRFVVTVQTDAQRAVATVQPVAEPAGDATLAVTLHGER